MKGKKGREKNEVGMNLQEVRTVVTLKLSGDSFAGGGYTGHKLKK